MSAHNKEEKPVTEPAIDNAAKTTTGKGRPTPKRRDQEAANRRPLVPDNKSATKEEKQRRKAARAKAREGMLRGDERYLAARDRGPMRRFLRDAVDTRWNIGEVLLPMMLMILAASLVNIANLQVLTFTLAWGLIIVGLADAVMLWRRTKVRATEIFGEAPGKGSAAYVILRAFQMRISRVPRPVVKRGDELRRH
ncbi:DUF3043 domain-containing protein [Ornithinimicrobium sp. Arc0846-15]|nr:DUF3043 domain-containing protein [Ornithinimicrobium laminariae]